MSKYALVERATGRVVKKGELIRIRHKRAVRLVDVPDKTILYLEPKVLWPWDTDGRWGELMAPDYQIVELPTVGTEGESSE